MTTPLKPCAHCGNATFHYLPGMQHPISHATSVLGIQASETFKSQYWTFTLIICTECGHSQTFTTNIGDVVQWIPGAGIMNAGPPR